MRLDLRDIIEMPGSSVSFETELSTEFLDFPSIKEYVSAPKASGRVFNTAGILTLEGEITADLVCICDRCGSEYAYAKRSIARATIVDEDDGDNPELFLLDGNELDLDEVLSSCFILDMDSKFLCSNDCQGLCPVCGKNLNLGPCGCRKKTDPRFAVLEQLLDK